jgi:hypothetical protein
VRRLAAYLAVPLLATSLVACGGGGEASISSTAPTAQTQAEASPELKRRNAEVEREYQQRKVAEAPTEEEKNAEEATTDFYAILAHDEAAKDKNKTTIDSTSFCELMSEPARQQTIRYAEVSSGIAREWDCESAVEFLVVRSKRSGGFEAAQKAEVIAVNARADKATATVRFGQGPVTSLPLVREDGEWKLAASSVPGGQ